MRHVVVVGGGIAGLATAHRLLQRDATVRVTVLEASPRLGGKVLSEQRQGFVLDTGPDSFIPQKPQTLELVRELGLEDRLLPSNDHQRGLAIAHQGRLEPVPAGLIALMPTAWREVWQSPLLSWRGKLDLLRERWIPPKTSGPAHDESLADFIRRRFGAEVLDRLAEPILAHIHVGDAERMSLAATYPRFAALERRFGSFWQAQKALQDQQAPRRATQARRPGSGSPLFWSLAGGMGELIAGLQRRLRGATVRTGVGVDTVLPGDAADRRWRVVLPAGEMLRADTVILAVPAFAAATLLGDSAPQLATQLKAIRYVSLATLSLGFRRRDLGTLPQGFGFFVPKGSPLQLLAGTWTSAKFTGRAPDDRVLVRLFLGGATQEAVLELDDDALVAAVRHDLGTLTGITAEPELTHLQRWPRGYPQYEVGHLDRVRALQEALPNGLELVGSAYGGVGLSDCIRGGYDAAERTLSRLEETARPLLAGGVVG